MARAQNGFFILEYNAYKKLGKSYFVTIKDWWKVECEGQKGFVPSSCLHLITDEDLKEDDESDDEETPRPQRTLMTRQQELEEA